MFTSYFGNRAIASHKNLIVIASSVPSQFKLPYRNYNPLIPGWRDLIKPFKQGELTELLYEELYQKNYLKRLNPRKVFYTDLGIDAVLLCWEAPDRFCHRRLVANWLEKELGVEVPELPKK